MNPTDRTGSGAPELTVPAYPAATVMLLREARSGIEVLLIRRNPNLAFHGGVWAFPGGRVEPHDFSLGDDHDLVAAARRAAVRETEEEVGVRVETTDLVPVSHWTTPEDQPKRFATWFFATSGENQPVQVDGGETLDSRWFRPEEALAAREAEEIAFLPPTFISIYSLLPYRSLGHALSGLSDANVGVFAPRNMIVPGGFCQLYEEDVAYGGGDIDQPGKRHRLWGMEGGWTYERTDS